MPIEPTLGHKNDDVPTKKEISLVGPKVLNIFFVMLKDPQVQYVLWLFRGTLQLLYFLGYCM
jgi:hypothetical protein